MKWKHCGVAGARAAAAARGGGAATSQARPSPSSSATRPGGGYDATARMLARYLPKHLPGKPTVIVQNMPGGNSIIAANHMYNVAKPDGLTIGTFNRNLPIAQLTGVQGVKYDITKFQWIGSAANETTILAIRTDLPYKNFDELRKARSRVVIGSTGPGANTHDFPLLLKDLLGVNLKIVSGYSSSARHHARGRAQGSRRPRRAPTRRCRPFIDRELVQPDRPRALDRGRRREACRSTRDFAPNPRAKAIMALRSAPEQVARPYVLPPNTPADIVKVMRDAFAAAIKDPELVAKEAAKAKFDLEFTPGDEAQKILADVLHQPKDIVDEFSQVHQVRRIISGRCSTHSLRTGLLLVLQWKAFAFMLARHRRGLLGRAAAGPRRRDHARADAAVHLQHAAGRGVRLPARHALGGRDHRRHHLDPLRRAGRSDHRGDHPRRPRDGEEGRGRARARRGAGQLAGRRGDRRRGARGGDSRSSGRWC